MGQIVSFPGTRSKTNEALEKLSEAEKPSVVTILPEDGLNILSVFIGENEGVYEFVSGWGSIDSYTAKASGITLNGEILMLRAYEKSTYFKEIDRVYQQVKNKMEETDYFRLTGI